MGTTRVTLTEATFINGSLYPAGVAVDVDLSSIGLKTVDDTVKPSKVTTEPDVVPLAPNLVTADGSNLIVAEIASVSPTGPAPTAPQAVTAGTTQVGEALVAPLGAEADGAGAALTPESPPTDDPKSKGK